MPTTPIIDIKAGFMATSSFPTDTLSMPELMTWLTMTMNKSDTAIRTQMQDIERKKNLNKALGEVITALQMCEGVKSGETGRVTTAAAGIIDVMKSDGTPAYKDSEWYKSLSPERKAAFDWFASDSGSDHICDQNAVTKAREALAAAVTDNTSSNDLAMIQLQSAIASRGQAIQLVSNMINSFTETSKSILGNIR